MGTQQELLKKVRERSKTTPSLPNAAGKGIAFLSTTATEAAWLWLMPPAQPPPAKHAPSVSWLCGPSSKRCSDFCSPATGLKGAGWWKEVLAGGLSKTLAMEAELFELGLLSVGDKQPSQTAITGPRKDSLHDFILSPPSLSPQPPISHDPYIT